MNELSFSGPLLAKQSGAGILEGYCSTFGGQPDLHNDVVALGAFSLSLKRHSEQNSRPALLWQHDQSLPLGVVSTLREDGHGLFVSAKLVLTATKASEAYDLAMAGGLGFSIGFKAIRSSPKNGYNLLEEIDLREVSLVSVPANAAAQVTSVKSLNGLETIRDFEHFLRDHGLSNRQAKALAVSGWPGYRPDDLSLVIDTIRKSAQQFMRYQK